VVFGNSPWEHIKIQEKEWFAERSPEIAEAPNAAAWHKQTAGLKDTDPALSAGLGVHEDANRIAAFEMWLCPGPANPTHVSIRTTPHVRMSLTWGTLHILRLCSSYAHRRNRFKVD